MMLRKIKKIRFEDICDFIKIIIAFIPGMILKFFYKEIWVIAEKKENARDNGVQFFKYAVKKKNKNVYYAIDLKCNDAKEILKYKKNLIKFGSLRHHIYTWAANSYISSEIDAGLPAPRICSYMIRMGIYGFNNIFLEHGITQNDLKCLYKECSGIDFITTATIKETEFFIDKFGYSLNEVKCTGFARYDCLVKEKRSNKILFMPTWRSEFDTDNNDYEYNKRKFLFSDYYKQIQNYINNEKLIEFLEENDLEFILYLHDKIQPYRNEFKSGSKKIIIPSKEEVNFHDMLINCDYFITDYSSVAFDAAYLKIPIQYFQYDINEFRNHLGEGYFLYEKDGFGPVITNINDSIDNIISSFNRGFNVTAYYKKRRDLFFKYVDRNNCKRINNAINSYEELVKKQNINKGFIVNKICSYFVFCLTILYILSYAFNFVKALAVFNLIYLILIIVPLLREPQKNIYLILFCVAIFTFLIGKPLICINMDDWWYKYNINNTKFAELLIAISEVTIFCTFNVINKVSQKKLMKKTKNNEKKINNINYNIIRKISLFLFSISFIFTLIVEIDKLIFMQGKSYEMLYTVYSNNFSSIVNFIAGIMPTAMCIYLVTFPTKKNSIVILFLYVITCIPSFIIGVRNPLVLSLLFSLSYFIIRDINEKWIKKIEKTFVLILIPIGILILSVFNYVRDNESIGNKDLFKDFFYLQGVTFDTIRISYDNIDTIRSLNNKNYTFGPFIDYIKYNTISQKVFKIKDIGNSNSVEKALKGNSFAHINSFLSRKDYLQGHGYGSSYIIETYVDYGYFGVVVFNIILTIFLFFAYDIIRRKNLMSVIILEASTTIFLIPRTEATQFLVFLITPHFIITTFAVGLLNLFFNRRVKKYENAKIS